MLYLMYGGDDVSLGEALSSMKEAVGSPDLRDVNISVLDGSEVSRDEVVSAAGTVPFLAERRMVIVKGLLAQFEFRARPRTARADTSPGEPALGQWEGLADQVSGIPETTDLVFVDGLLTGSNPLFVKLRPLVNILTFPVPKSRELPHWIRQRAIERGIDIEPRAISALADSIGPNLGVIDSELGKLSLYRTGQQVRYEDVQEMVAYVKEANIFAAVDAVLEGRPGIAVKSIHRLLAAGRTPGSIITMIDRQVRFLLLAKEIKAGGATQAEVGRRISLSGYPLRKTMEQEPKFSVARLMEIHRKLLETDVSIKTGETDESLALDLLVTELSAGRRRS